MKLLLTSSGFDNPSIFNKFIDLVGKPANKIKIIYIPTAANGEDDSSWIADAKKEIIKQGILKQNLMDFDLDKNPNYDLLNKADSIFVEGGNTFYLAKRFREEEFIPKIKRLLNKGVVYVGVSAGSVLAGKYIDIASPFDENKVGLNNFNGMNFTDKIISPHFNTKEKSIIEDYEKRRSNKVLRLNDGQALLNLNGKEKIIK